MKSTPVTIRFETSLYALKKYVILPLPKEESVKLPSRGQISVAGTVNGRAFQTVLEPDGNWSHWMKMPAGLLRQAGVAPGDRVSVELTTRNEWPEPDVPSDFMRALETAPQKVKEKWHDITPMARWEWIRWVNATGNADTRDIRIMKTISKLNGKHRRPCCFNLAACTDPYVSRSGRLMEAVHERE